MAADHVLRFGRIEIRASERLLRIDGENAVVGARAFDLLLALAERRDRLVGKQELLDLVWPGRVVEEHNIAAQMSTLRKLLGPDAIATVPGRGYRFVAPTGVDRTAVSARPPALAGGALTPLVGRGDELGAIAGLVARHRVVTLIGTGGIGKTLLARHVVQAAADRFEQGAGWIDLASVSNGADVAQRVADALGLRLAGGDARDALAAAAAALQMLIAFDNAEHLLADVALVVQALLDAAPGVSALVTSQAPLRLAAEQIYRVGPLAVPEGPLPAAFAQTFAAVALFVERARGADARFVLADADAPAAIELCRALDGVPLAIELAAARAPLLGVRVLAASMRDRLSVLTRNRDAAAPARQQTLRAALAWSHDRLSARERIVFRRLAVMAGSASLDFVCQVVSDAETMDAWAVLDTLGELVDRSLVAVLPDADPDGEQPRYRLLESPRELALEQLRAAGEEGAVRRRHASALAAAFDAAWHERWSGRIGVLDWSHRFMRDVSHAREAIAWARGADEPESAVLIAATLRLALPPPSHLEAMALGDLCESLADRITEPAIRLRALDAAIRPMTHRHQQRSLELAEHALALARTLDAPGSDRWRLCKALSAWIDAASLIAGPRHASIRAALRELDALEDPSWPAPRRAVLLNTRRWAHVALHPADEHDEQLRLTRRWIEAVTAARGDVARCIGSLIDAELTSGNVHEAVQLGERTLAELTSERDEWNRMMVRSNLALALLALDEVDRVRVLMRQAWTVALRFGMPMPFSDSLALMAALERRHRTAALLAGHADAAYEVRSLTRHPNERAARQRAEAIARPPLGNLSFDTLLAQGRLLRDEQIEALAFDRADAPR